MSFLCLSRLVDQSIMIGDEIKITVLRTGTKTMLGIEAPENIKVHRVEVYETIKRMQEEQNAKRIASVVDDADRVAD